MTTTTKHTDQPRSYPLAVLVDGEDAPRWTSIGSGGEHYERDARLAELWRAGQKPPLLMLDLCAGLGGASQAMRDRGWRVVTLDNDPQFSCDITTDLREWSYHGPRPDLIWLSDPCTEFSRESMPWSKTGNEPDLSIAQAGLRIIREIQPRYWVRENVRGSVRWVWTFLGAPREIHGPFFLWGNFPPIGKPVMRMRKKESYSSERAAERGKIPYALSLALAIAVECQGQLRMPAEAPGRWGEDGRAKKGEITMAHETWRETARRVILKALEEAQSQGLDAADTLALVDGRYPFGERAYHPYKMWLSERKNLVISPAAPKVRAGRAVFGGAIKDDQEYSW